VVFRVRFEKKVQKVDPSTLLLGSDLEQVLALPNGSILIKLDRLHWALVHAGPALNTILGAGRIRLLFFDFIDLAGTDLDAVSAAITFPWVDDRIHGYFKLQIPNYKYQTNSKPKCPINKTKKFTV
jgi:hypothetical protein